MAAPRRSNSRRRSGKLRAALLIALIPGVLGILLSRWPPAESLERRNAALGINRVQT